MIVGLSGRSESGKNTCANFLVGTVLCSNVWPFRGELLTFDEFQLKDSKLQVKSDGGFQTIDLDNPSPILEDFLVANIFPHIKLYSFADKLKRLAIDLFNLTEEQCYGSAKDTYTDLYWEKLPLELSGRFWKDSPVPSGKIKARQMLQLLGTEVFRWIDDNIWAAACIRQIQAESPELAVITDVRFVSECNMIKQAGGKIIRLTRNIKNMNHASENELDNYTEFDYVLDNSNMTIEEQCDKLYHVLKQLGCLPFVASIC